MSDPPPIELSDDKQAAIDAVNNSKPNQDYLWRDLRFHRMASDMWKVYSDTRSETMNPSMLLGIINSESQ